MKETAKRDYKAEYKKFQSSPKSKKYRAELNKYNRKKGTYGNGDGKDASHKGGKISGFEKESVNRGRREKSRMKKEQKLREAIRKIIREDFAGSYPEHVRKKFDNKRRKQSEVLGYKLTGVNDVKTEIDDATIKEGFGDKFGKMINSYDIKIVQNALAMAKQQALADKQKGSEQTPKLIAIKTINRMKEYRNKIKAPNLKKEFQKAINKLEKDYKTIKEHMAGGLTYKKGKTVTVTHKTSGKELVIIDKPSVRKEYEKIGYVAEGKLTEKIDMNKKYPPFEIAKKMLKHPYWKKYGQGWEKKLIKKFRGRAVSAKMLDKWLPDFIEGKYIYALFEGKLNEAKESAIDVAKRVVQNKQHEKGLDLTTANFIMQVYNAYKKNPSLQKKLEKMPLKKMVSIVYKLIK